MFQFNFVGKLLGPRGRSLQRLQSLTKTRMAILGRGSMKDKRKEEYLVSTNNKEYDHLNQALHVEITAMAHPAEAHRRIASALTEVTNYDR